MYFSHSAQEQDVRWRVLLITPPTLVIGLLHCSDELGKLLNLKAGDTELHTQRRLRLSHASRRVLSDGVPCYAMLRDAT